MKGLKGELELRSKRADLLVETLDLAARGWPEDYRQIEMLDQEIEGITRMLEGKEG